MSVIYCRRTKALITELSVPAPGSKDLYFRTQYSQSSLVQFRACLWKLHYSYWRNTMYTAMRLLFAALVGVVFGSVFWKIGKERYVKLIMLCTHNYKKKKFVAHVIPKLLISSTLQKYPTKFVQCNGFNVLRSYLPWHSELVRSSTSCVC